MGLWFNRFTGQPYANVGGAPMFATRAQLEACCCLPPAPCSCPCSTWPPESWPCADLTEAYFVQVHVRFRLWPTNDCSGAPSIDCAMDIATTVHAGGPCIWYAIVSTPNDCPYPGASWYVQVAHFAALCQWTLGVDSMGYGDGYAVKATGQTPIGAYVQGTPPCIPDYITGSAKIELTGAEVS